MNFFVLLHKKCELLKQISDTNYEETTRIPSAVFFILDKELMIKKEEQLNSFSEIPIIQQNDLEASFDLRNSRNCTVQKNASQKQKKNGLFMAVVPWRSSEISKKRSRYFNTIRHTFYFLKLAGKI